MTFTVRELAEELVVSKQAIHKKINQLPSELTPKKLEGDYQLTEEIADSIRASVKNATTVNQPVNQPVDGEVGALKMMIKELKEEKAKLYDQLERKDEQLSQLQKLVNQQQQLTLQANHHNERLQLQLQVVQEKENEVVESADDSCEQKKWWQFWTKRN